MRLTSLLVLVTACSPRSSVVLCDTPGVMASQTCTSDDCTPCVGLAKMPIDADPAFATELFITPEDDLDWPAIDAALADGDVAVRFSGEWPDALQILRTDDGPHRLLLDGTSADGDRARFAGATTTEDDVKRSRVTLRGFELAHSSSQTVYWRAGDEVILEDLVLHDNGRSPALMLDYANRSGLPSTGLVVRNNHLYDVSGECIYIGGAEDTGGPSHSDVRIENNLIHGCGHKVHWGDDLDGINIKDGIAPVVIRRNVISETHWGMQIDSPALIEQNVIFDILDHGIMLGDQWGASYSTAVIRDLAVLRSKESGVYVGADHVPTDGVTLERLTVADVDDFGVEFAGASGVVANLADVLFVGDMGAFKGWGDVSLEVTGCSLAAGAVPGQFGADCVATDDALVDPDSPAGPDGLFFTEDDGWRSRSGAGAR